MPEYSNVLMMLLDVEKYTDNAELYQIDIFKKLQKEVYYHLFDDIHLDDNVIIIPTGDGFFIGLNKNEATANSQNFIKLLDLISHLKKSISEVNIRYAIHEGSIQIIRDINRKENLVGNVINDLSRIINHSEVDGVVVSDKVFEKYFKQQNWEKSKWYKLNKGNDYQYQIISEASVKDKNNKCHHIFSVSFQANETRQIGREFEIKSRHIGTVYGSDYPKDENMKTNFSNRLKNAKDIVLLGIFHPNTPAMLEKNINPKEKTCIRIYYAADSLIGIIQDFLGKSKELSLETKSESLTAVKEWYSQIERKDLISFELYEYYKFPYFGASSTDFLTRDRGFIHISNYFKNILPKETPYVEVFYSTNEMSPLYKFYYEQLNEFIQTNKTKINLEVV